jgi:hypothetical protein
MNQTISVPFGNANERVEYALAALRRGQEVLVTYDEARENGATSYLPPKPSVCRKWLC